MKNYLIIPDGTNDMPNQGYHQMQYFEPNRFIINYKFTYSSMGIWLLIEEEMTQRQLNYQKSSPALVMDPEG